MPRTPLTGSRALWARLSLACAATATILIASSASGQPSDPLATGFVNPPAVAKPRVWWHWIDGNVSEHGIQEDLTWLNQVGIGGVHNFDAALTGSGAEPARLVQKRIAYLTPEWRQMFRVALTEAHRRDMEFTIAASPGWSESGGPWVKPAQGMKKLVWSETLVPGGKPFNGLLRAPPQETGPFQDVPFASLPFATETQPPQYYVDAAVVAYRLPSSEPTDADLKPQVTSSAGQIDTARLCDGDLSHPVSLPYGQGKTSWIQFAYVKPQRIQSMTVSVARPVELAPSDIATGGSIWLEAGDDGQTFQHVVDVPRSGAPQQTLEFKPVTARFYRLVLERPDPQPSGLEALLGIPSDPPASAHSVFEVVLHADPRVNRFEDKAGFSNRAITSADDTPAVASHEATPKDGVIDLTSRMHPDGTLDWTPPRGRWVVLRFGYSLTGHTNHPASKEGTGLEVDKLNKEHVKAYFDAYFGEYQKTLDPQMIGKQGLQYMLTDSYEAGIANWTDDLLAQFSQRRGYDPRPYLPVLAGRVVVSAQASDRFLWDFRQTLGDLIADAYYGELSALLHEHGLGRYGESHESGRAFVGDGMQVKKSADVPMGALWSSTLGQPRETFDADIRESASVAHIYGQNLVAAESLTAFGNTFAFTPETLKPFADRELADGLNRFVIHTSVHQPDDRLGPGVTLGPFGQWFTRHETWSQEAQPWVTYLARSDYLLQQGRFVADIAYLYGEDNNITNLFGSDPPPIPRGYNFDYVNADALVNVFSVKEDRLSTPSGMQYRLLALDPSTQRMSLPVLRKISALVKQGAMVVGQRPTMTPSLADDENEFNTLAEGLWGAHPSLGKGKVLAEPLATALPQLSIAPDCAFIGPTQDQAPSFVHRHLEQGDLYFVTNRTDTLQTVRASFRVSGKAPQLWRADTGEIAPATYYTEGERTAVPLKLQPYEAVFVVFRDPASEPNRLVKEPLSEVVATVSGPWEVSFPPDHGAPPHAHFAELSSWTTSSDPGVKYFSGTATYSTAFTANVRSILKGAHIQLDLGDVKNLAEVTLNGKPLGVLWKHPFVIDVTSAMHLGKNQLEVKVTNVWPNRLIGDKQPGAHPIAHATFDPYKADSPLLPSGLLGPVTLSRVTQP
jgi:(4-O-methyl)-D-glucuronate---lignin esterase